VNREIESLMFGGSEKTLMKTVLFCAAALCSCAPSMPSARTRVQPALVAAEDVVQEGALDAAAAIDAGPRDPLLALADEITERMTRVRQLPLRAPISSGTLSRAEILARLRTRVGEEYRADELDREGALYRVTGLWNDRRDYAETSFALLEEQVAGFYDPTRKHLFVASWLSPLTQGPTLAHEITHALQDQHFDIARFTRHERGAGDRQLSAMTVVEGDATLATVAFSGGRSMLVAQGRVALQQLQGAVGGGERLSSAPLVLRETLIFPYREGLRLCVDAYESGGWRAVDALLREPPASTEQVLHADKLASREAPVAVSVELPTALAGTHELGYFETFGELGVQLWLRTWLSEDVAVDAAAGWGGDRAALLVPRGTTAVTAQTRVGSLWLIAMDSSPFEREALALERAVVGYLRQRYPRARRARVAGATHALRVGETEVSLVASRGRSVLIAEGIPAASAADVVREALSRAP
jgi:hypothetical protein